MKSDRPIIRRWASARSGAEYASSAFPCSASRPEMLKASKSLSSFSLPSSSGAWKRMADTTMSNTQATTFIRKRRLLEAFGCLIAMDCCMKRASGHGLARRRSRQQGWPKHQGNEELPAERDHQQPAHAGRAGMARQPEGTECRGGRHGAEDHGAHQA